MSLTMLTIPMTKYMKYGGYLPYTLDTQGHFQSVYTSTWFQIDWLIDWLIVFSVDF